MNYEDLRRIQHAERNAKSSLTEIDANFYNDLANYVAELRGKQAGPDSARLFENVLKVSRDIFEHREQKLLQKSLRAVRTGEAAAAVPMAEAKLLADLESALRQNRTAFDDILLGRAAAQARAPSLDDIPKINGNGEQKQEDLNSVLVRIIKKVPRFVSSELKEFGPFEVNEITRLPAKEADLLFSRSFIEKI
jgi:DNA replication initiation complex subunit (GINS family)